MVFGSIGTLSLVMGFTVAATCALAIIFSCACLMVLAIIVSFVIFLPMKSLCSTPMGPKRVSFLPEAIHAHLMVLFIVGHLTFPYIVAKC